MKEGIHPKYQKATVTCVCGNTFETGSTKKALRVENKYTAPSHSRFFQREFEKDMLHKLKCEL